MHLLWEVLFLEPYLQVVPLSYLEMLSPYFRQIHAFYFKKLWSSKLSPTHISNKSETQVITKKYFQLNREVLFKYSNYYAS